MPVENLNFLGINRAISDFSPSSACEEIINLRPSTNGLVPVKPFSRIMTNVEYDKVFVHKTSTVTNYIGVKLAASTMDIDLIGGTGHLYQIPAYTHLTIDQIHFAYAGNVILFSVSDPEDHFYQNIAFLWKDVDPGDDPQFTPSYSPIRPGLQDFTPTISIDQSSYTLKEISIDPFGNDSYGEFVDKINNRISQIQEENPSVCFGPIIIAIAFKTKGGDTFWTGEWLVFDPAAYIRIHTGSPYVSSAGILPSPYNTKFIPFFNKYTQGGYTTINWSYGDAWKVKLAGEKVSINIPQLSWWDDKSSSVSSLEIYASRPQMYVDTSALLDNYDLCVQIEQDLFPMSGAMVLIPAKKYTEMELGEQLLYHQASIQMYELKTAARNVPLSFGGNIQVGNDTLDVDAGMVTRFGEVMSYNARFHFFNSMTKTDLGIPKIATRKYSALTSRLYYFVKYQVSGMESVEERYVGYEDMSETDASSSSNIVIAPTTNIKEVTTFYPTNQAMTTGFIFKYRMNPSSTYNFSICVDGGSAYTGDKSYYAGLIIGGIKRIIENEERDTINVTEQYDPFVFNVDHSYLAPGKVIDIQPQMSFTREDPYGIYPLNVFTSRGVYALMQGSSNVLYGAFYPMTGLVSVSNSIPTQLGTFFLAAGALWLISGSHPVLISDALSLGPHTYIRDNDGFKKISLGYGALPGSYSVATILSTVPFKDYVYKESIVSEQTVISKATLSYNPYNEELYVSNKDYNYTYALSTKHRQWFKLSGKIWQDVPGSNIANKPGASPYLLNVVDFSGVDDETQMVVHIQSRPFSFAMQYAHIHRIVAMIRAELGFFSSLSYHSADTLVVALYGSDNLQDWSLLSYAQRAGTSTSEEIGGETVVTETPLKISQIRTPSASRSWRYYTICIGGKVHYDTDFGQVMIDYQPVARRLG